MRHLITIVFFIFGVVFPPFCAANAVEKASKTYNIGITQIVEHPALNDVRLGLIESLKSQGFVHGKNLIIHYDNAQGNMVTSTQIATKLLSTHLDIIVAISTPSAQTVYFAAQRAQLKIPIVYTAVSDPVAARLEPGESKYPITGITDEPDSKALLSVMQKMLPKLKTVGLLYNPSEPNSVSTINQFKKIFMQNNIMVREVTVNNTADVGQAMQSLVGTVDAVYFPQDNTVVSAIESVSKFADSLPLFCSDPVLVKRGVLAAVGYSYKEIGKEAGEAVAKLLKGENISQIPVHHPLKLETVVNEALVKRFKFSLPEGYTAVDRAAKSP